ncbi:hypothetical protein [uncultured Rikenella sp.]|uniref:hypothetical protein n=1 Tax=uncultured Rikenella sp. TaxID=368003 RepID=UPI00261E4CDE|nr:hypothetical protein [uncultured Rikenella sp.]
MNILCPRAGGNLVQKRKLLLNDFLLQLSRAGCRSALEPGRLYPESGEEAGGKTSIAKLKGTVPYRTVLNKPTIKHLIATDNHRFLNATAGDIFRNIAFSGKKAIFALTLRRVGWPSG